MVGINILSESPWPTLQTQLLNINGFEVLNILRPILSKNFHSCFSPPLLVLLRLYESSAKKCTQTHSYIYIQLLFDSRKIPMSRKKVLYQKYPKNTIHYFTIFLSCVLKKILLEEFDTQFERYCFKLLLCAFKHKNRVFGKKRVKLLVIEAFWGSPWDSPLNAEKVRFSSFLGYIGICRPKFWKNFR